MQLNCELLERMAERRIGWSLTMATALLHVGPIAEQAGPRERLLDRAGKPAEYRGFRNP